MKRNITLIGMPGSGKSYIGEYISNNFNYEQIDGDRDILIPQIINLSNYLNIYGDEAFLDIEERLFLNYDFKFKNQIITPGGSIIYRENIMNKLNELSEVFYLKTDFKTISNRLSLRGVKEIVGICEKNLYELYLERVPLYGKYSKYVIDTNFKNVKEISEEILTKVN